MAAGDSAAHAGPLLCRGCTGVPARAWAGARRARTPLLLGAALGSLVRGSVDQPRRKTHGTRSSDPARGLAQPGSDAEGTASAIQPGQHGKARDRVPLEEPARDEHLVPACVA